jgi:AcrR family transcriptional regulator
VTAPADQTTDHRTPLNRERVLTAAIDVADEHGIEALTMRRLGQHLGVEAMSLYNHVANKDDLLTGVVDMVLGEIMSLVVEVAPPIEPPDWKCAMRERILIARSVLVRHPWMPSVIESRTQITPVLLAWFDELIGLFRAGGFSYDLAHHALHALGSRALGFTQELFVPGDDDEGASRAGIDQMTAVFPNLGGMLSVIVHDEPGATLGWCDDQTEFVFGLDLLLDGLERLRPHEPSHT